MLPVILKALRSACCSAVQVLCCLLLALAAPAFAQELLVNGSFENPAAPQLGNNFYATIPSWTVVNVTPVQAQPFNLIRPHAGYANNPPSTPTGGGVQYLDINSAAGTIRQSFTLATPGVVTFSGWYSIRDFPQALAGLTISILNAGGTTVASGSTSFTAADPIGLWKQVQVTGVGLAAGTYTYQAIIPNFANFDIASVVRQPGVTLTKSSATYWDPVNLFVNPKAIPGALITYTIALTTPAYPITSDSITLVDATPGQLALVVTDFGAVGKWASGVQCGQFGIDIQLFRSCEHE